MPVRKNNDLPCITAADHHLLQLVDGIIEHTLQRLLDRSLDGELDAFAAANSAT